MVKHDGGVNHAVDIPLRAHPNFFRWTVVATNVFIPWLLTSLLDALCSLADTKSNHPMTATLGLGLVGFLICISVGHILIVRRGEVFGVVCSLCVGVLFLAIWLAAGQVYTYILFFLGFLVLSLTRVASLYRAAALTVPNERMFRTDTYSFIAIFLLLGLAQLGRTNIQTATLDNALVFFGVCYIGLRVWTFWRIQRLETATKGAPKLGLVLIALIALFGVLLAPSLGAVFVRTFMAAGAIGGIIGAFLGMFIGKTKSKTETNSANSQHPSGNSHPHSVLNYSTPGDAIFIALLLVVVLIFIVVLIRYLKAKNVGEVGGPATEQTAEPTTKRVWIRSADGFAFLEVTHPIRRRYQQFIKRAKKRGVTMKASETPRQFERRLLESWDGEYDRDITHLYERVRYGGDERDHAKS